MKQTEVLVIGGGVLGCAGTFFLARRGVSVVLAELMLQGKTTFPMAPYTCRAFAAG